MSRTRRLGSASCGKVGPVFRSERCAHKGTEHRINPKSGLHFWVRCSGPRILGSLVLAAALAGCSGFGGDVSLPANAPRVIGPDRDRDHVRLVRAFGGEGRAPQLQQLLTDVTNRL